MSGATVLLRGLLRHPPESVAMLPGIRPKAARAASTAVTYGDLARGSEEVARRLTMELSGRPMAGARVALLLPPGETFVIALLGVWRVGATALPLSATHTAPEVAHMLSVAQPVATLVESGGDFAALRAAGTGGGRIIDIDIELASLGRKQKGVTSGQRGADAPSPFAAVFDDSAALMLFTSGTTGKPKGVALSHAGVAATLEALAEAWQWRADDRLLHALPLYHTHGLIVALLGALWAGASVGFVSFNAPAIWDALARASVFMAVPTMYVRLVEALQAAAPDQRAVWAGHARALRLCTSGSAALPGALLSTFAQATGQTILERYGMTEIGMALSNPYIGARVPGSVGLPLPRVTVDIVDEAGASVPAGVPGELRVRSPQLFIGYHGDSEATAAATDEQRRFRTGDTGVRDHDGYIRLLGRTSVDILKSGGYKLSALEIEDVLREHPAVSEVAVIGVPDSVWGDCVTACVVPRAGAAITLDELRAFAREALAPYKLPRALRLIDELPRNAMGKVQKSLLK